MKCIVEYPRLEERNRKREYTEEYLRTERTLQGGLFEGDSRATADRRQSPSGAGDQKRYRLRGGRVT